MKSVYDILSREPQEINENSWYYEEKDGIEIIYCDEPMKTRKEKSIKISWKKLGKSLERYKKFKQQIQSQETKQDYEPAGVSCSSPDSRKGKKNIVQEAINELGKKTMINWYNVLDKTIFGVCLIIGWELIKWGFRRG